MAAPKIPYESEQPHVQLQPRIASPRWRPARWWFASVTIAAAATWVGPARGETEVPATADRGHWSFQPLAADSPRPADDPWISNPIDAFILSRLKERNLRPSPPASRATLIRRIYLDVLGLPPTPEEVEAFRRDAKPGAYPRLVDRVLASPHYGERWGRHWLDAVRFAETNGFETNRERPTAYWFRDYVIHSLNGDKPYDELIREQIAGDVLATGPAGTGDQACQPAIGTGFLAAGPYDIVRSPDIGLTLMQRQDVLADVVNTTATTFLALTVGCARCHDHKFDPISQRDYYAMQAVFAGFQQGERDVPRRRDARDEAELQTLRASAEQLRNELAEWEQKGERLLTAARRSDSLRPAVTPSWNEERFPAVPARFVKFVIHETSGGEPCIDELAIFNAAGENVALAARGSRATASGTLPGYPIHQLHHVNDGRTGNDRSWISNTPGSGWVQIEFTRPHDVTQIVWSRDRARHFRDRVATGYEIQVATEEGHWETVASSRDRIPFAGDSQDSRLDALTEADRALAVAARERLADVERRIESLSQSVTKAWVGTFTEPEPTKLLYRGDPLAPRDVVAPAPLTALGGRAMELDEPEGERRRRLAEWISDPSNPLTPRVIVNRIWQHHFGTGIVATPGDFGRNGALPSHPRLLDWLAAELIRADWSLKQIHRRILLSRTYQQQSLPDENALAVDADTRLLWRFPPRRLAAEAIRDSILATSGALDRRLGGPGFSAFEVELENVRHYFPKQQWGPGDWRRMIYMTKVRQEQDAVFGIFDCPDGNQTIDRRSRSTTPLQALNLLNSQFVIQQAQLAAARIRDVAGPEPKRQAEAAFDLFYGRPADDHEAEDAARLIRTHGLPALCRALFNTNEFLFLF